MSHRLFRVAPVLLIVALLGGCGHTSWSSNQTIRYGVVADEVRDLESRVVSQDIDGEHVRIRNLAGTVTLVEGDVDTVQVEATVYAKGRSESHTTLLLDEMNWERVADRKGRQVWTLSWPLERHQKFHYSTDGRGFEMTNSKALGRKVTVTTRKLENTPTLFADLVVTCPPGSTLDMYNLAGPVDAESLTGIYALKTGAGTIDVGAFDGDLTADTGSGDVTVGSLVGSTYLDTGSGDIVVNDLRATANLDTGSGDIVVNAVDSDDVRADTGSGRILIKGGTAERIVADTGSGDIRLEGTVFHSLHADTGSGDITIHSPLTETRSIHADTGSGDVTIVAGDAAAFDLNTSIGSGRLTVGYDDARLRHDGKYVTGATRGDGGARIHVDTGSGDCTIEPGA